MAAPHSPNKVKEAGNGKLQIDQKILYQRSYGSRYKSWRTCRNKIRTAIWPGSLINLTCLVGGVTLVRLSHVDFLDPLRGRIISLEELLPFTNGALRIACSSSLVGLGLFTGLTLSRRLLLRWLLAYRQWMYEPPGKESWESLLWGTLVKLLSGWSPSMYSHQSCLPRLPVPSLDETLNKLIVSLAPLYEQDLPKLTELKQEAELFKKNVGYKLQRALVLRSLWCDNFVSDWWEKYVYLMNRSPLPINSNYYIMDQCYHTPTSSQCARAAGTLYQYLLVRDQLLTEDFKPLLLRDVIPTCMSQYRRIFSTTRIPGEEMDKLIHYPDSQSKHVVVSRRGLFYKLDITNKRGYLVSPSHLEQQLEWILQDADTRYTDLSESERLVAALTSMDRTSWAKVRQEFFSLGVNKESLQYLESAVLFLVLDTVAFSDLSSRAAHLLHGSVGSFWFDKSMQLIVMSDGHIGINCEHSYADAPAIAHVFEHNLTYEIISELYDEEGHCVDLLQVKADSKPVPLSWEVEDKLQSWISRACSQAEQNINDLDLVVFDHTDFGKGDIKKCKLSPDAFIQMALHVTYRKLTGTPVLTYEASMTRLYKHGRTETVRSLTKEANNFVNAFLDPEKTSDEKRKLLRVACDKHAVLYKDAMNGKGIDRHLFALYVASKGLGLDSEFLKTVLSLPWTLSTSQQPQQQISWAPSCSGPQFHNMVSPGGGFGPVAEDGYGVSYMVPGDHRFFFHVSSRKSGRGTNSTKFVETLGNTISEIIKLHQNVL